MHIWIFQIAQSSQEVTCPHLCFEFCLVKSLNRFYWHGFTLSLKILKVVLNCFLNSNNLFHNHVT